MPPSPIRIFVVDDQTIFRESLIAVLSLHKDLRVVGQAGNYAEATPLLSKSNFDILLLDPQLPDRSGFDMMQDVAQRHPQCKTIITADAEDEDEAVQAMSLGARGYLGKLSRTDLFIKAIQKVHAGEIWLNGAMTEAVLASLSVKQPNQKTTETSTLSPRELEVIQLVIQGYKNRDIANDLFISEKTVKNHLSSIFNKLGVSDRLELTLYVFQNKFLQTAAG